MRGCIKDGAETQVGDHEGGANTNGRKLKSRVKS